MSVSLSSPLLDSSLCILDLRSRSRDAALGELAHRLAGTGALRDSELLREALLRRERYASTAIGKGVAIPNARSLAVAEARMLLARSARGLAWQGPDAQAVHLVCAVVSPAEWSEEAHLESLGRAIGALRLQRHRQRLLEETNLAAARSLWRELLG